MFLCDSEKDVRLGADMSSEYIYEAKYSWR